MFELTKLKIGWVSFYEVLPTFQATNMTTVNQPILGKTGLPAVHTKFSDIGDNKAAQQGLATSFVDENGNAFWAPGENFDNKVNGQKNDAVRQLRESVNSHPASVKEFENAHSSIGKPSPPHRRLSVGSLLPEKKEQRQSSPKRSRSPQKEAPKAAE